MALLTIAADERSLAERVAERVIDVATASVRTRGVAMICLTGGTTPKRTYELLGAHGSGTPLACDRVHLYWTDERMVPPDHHESNFGMVRNSLLVHAPVPSSHVHRIKGELPPEEAALLYERELPERFDLMMLGVGEDTHIASIFPSSPLLAERRRRAAAVWAPHLNAYRVTLTPRALLESDRILMMVAGTAKAAAVAAAIEGPTDVARCPVHLVREAGDRVEWFIDRAAARELSSRHA